MSNILWTKDSIGFIPSNLVKIFPCSYRGKYNYTDTETNNEYNYSFDPEASATTEYNIVNLYSKLGKDKESYLLDLTSADHGKNLNECTNVNLKFILGGYYFELNSIPKEEITNKYLVINFKNTELTNSNVDSLRETMFLKSLNSDSDLELDILGDGDYASKHFFVGLGVANSNNNYAHYLLPLLKNDSNEYIINWTENTILNSIGTGSGAYSIRSLTDNADQKNNVSGKHSIAFGSGLISNSDNQLIIGKYNQNDSNLQFVIGSGTTESTRSNSFSIDTSGNINSCGNTVTLNNTIIEDTPQLLKIKPKSGDNKSLVVSKDIETKTGSLKVGNNAIHFKDGSYFDAINYDNSDKHVNITKDLHLVETSDEEGNKTNGNLIADGSVTVGGDLNIISGTATIGGKLNTYDDVEIEKNLNVHGNTEINGTLDIFNTLTVEDNKKTTLGGELEVKQATNLKSTLTVGGDIVANSNTSNNLTLGSAVGSTEVEASWGTISVYGKSNTKIFEVTDDGATAVAGTLSVTDETQSGTNADGVYSKGALYVAGGATIVGNLFAGSTQISGLHVENDATITGKTIITNNLEITSKATSAETVETDTDNTLTTKKYIIDKINNSIDSKIAEIDGTTSIAETNTGKYLQSLTQTDGRVTAYENTFETNLNPETNNNVPTSKAVSNYISNYVTDYTTKYVTNYTTKYLETTNLENSWINEWNKEKNESSTKDTLKDVVLKAILDATYPIGSIYIMHSSEPITDCPIKNSLGGTWEAITTGKFLVAAQDTNSEEKYYIGSTGGSADAVVVKHTHKYSNAESANNKIGFTGWSGDHEHNVTFYATEIGTGSLTGFEGNRGDDRIKDEYALTTKTSKANQHIHDLPAINSAGENDGTNANLPPYLSVYMWKRINDPVE